MRQATLMKVNPMAATSLASDRRSINAASGQKMSCGIATQMSVSPVSSARKPRTEPKYSGIKNAVDVIVKRKNETKINMIGIGGPQTTLKLRSGWGERHEWIRIATSNKTPADSNPHTNPEFNQSSRLP